MNTTTTSSQAQLNTSTALEIPGDYRGCAQTCPVVESLVEKNDDLKEQVVRISQERDDALAKVDALEGRVRKQQQKIFGANTEKGSSPTEDDRDEADSSNGEEDTKKRSRGGQVGHKGHGRKTDDDLEEKVIDHELEEDECVCPECGLPLEDMGTTEDSFEYNVEFRYTRVVHKRHKYRRTCSCEGSSIVTVPVVPKLIPKGKFSVDFWCKVLFDRFVLNLPYARQIIAMESQGLKVPASTLSGGLKKILEYLLPLYVLLITVCQDASFWQMDETRWPVFVDKGEKKTHNWWLWVFSSKMVVAYIIDPTRSSKVPKELLKEKTGILSADRYSVYKTLLGIIIAFCWAHQRRDFVNLTVEFEDGHKIHIWAQEWIDLIAQVYHLDKVRHGYDVDSEQYMRITEKLRGVLDAMNVKREKQLEHRDQLHDQQIKVLKSLENHWSGLILFVDHPEVPIDNNFAERMIRPLAVARKNSYGSHSVWGAELMAVVSSIVQTCRLHGVDPLAFLQLYLGECAKSGGVPENLEDFLPWNTHLINESKECEERGP